MHLSPSFPGISCPQPLGGEFFSTKTNFYGRTCSSSLIKSLDHLFPANFPTQCTLSLWKISPAFNHGHCSPCRGCFPVSESHRLRICVVPDSSAPYGSPENNGFKVIYVELHIHLTNQEKCYENRTENSWLVVLRIGKKTRYIPLENDKCMVFHPFFLYFTCKILGLSIP